MDLRRYVQGHECAGGDLRQVFLTALALLFTAACGANEPPIKSSESSKPQETVSEERPAPPVPVSATAPPRLEINLSCQIETGGTPGQNLLDAALPRLQVYPEEYKGEIERNRPLEKTFTVDRFNDFNDRFAKAEERFQRFPDYQNFEQITSDLSETNSLYIKGYGIPCEFCPGVRLDEFIFRSEPCAKRWYGFALEMNTEIKAVGFIRRKDKTVIVTWPSAYFMRKHLPDIEKAIFGDIDPEAAYQKAEAYVPPG